MSHHGMLRRLGMLGLGAAMLHLLPARARAADEIVAPECMDDAWAYYNACLVSSKSEFRKRLCDARFVLDTAICADRLR